jgi:hypothetical protein
MGLYDSTTYSKRAIDLQEDDVFRLSTGDGLIYYCVDTDPVRVGTHRAEIWVTEIDEDNENPLGGSEPMEIHDSQRVTALD